MEPDGPVSGQEVPAEVPLPDTYRALNAQRAGMDRSIATLAPDDPARDALWQDLERVLQNLDGVVARLAQSPAAQLSDLRAKADVLATLLQAGDAGQGPVVSDDARSALTLSLIGDIVRLVSA